MTATGWPDDALLGDARQYLMEARLRGTTCPCCQQHTQQYKRTINSGMARSLIAMWTAAGLDWQHVPSSIGARSREEGKLAYWRLVEEERTLRPDGGRAGYWRVTERGAAYAQGHIALPRYAHVYNGRCLGLSGQPESIVVALGKRFNLAKLLAGEA